MALDADIDRLYQLPLAEFTAARNALAKTLKGDEAKQVKALPKPTVVPWAVNQLYWKARPVYERLTKSGDALRTAQIAALKGGKADVRKASEAHRTALAEAVEKTTALAAAAGSQPEADALSRTLESLSLAAERPRPPGRLTEALRPAGFEALLGVTPSGGPRPVAPAATPASTRAGKGSPPDGESPADRRARREAEREAAREAAREKAREEARARERRTAIQAAEKGLEQARTTHARARREAEAAQRALEEAEAGVRDAERALFAAKQS